ncbi:hypothetical protein [Enterocloster clostridioformis]|uniref:hypothetical protein n=1 Tax=Enterocloster clostridioformis TaxID=1531 RepID=UPI0012BC691B|nr:hypothetical protein [Enterocloster clostridioformis]
MIPVIQAVLPTDKSKSDDNIHNICPMATIPKTEVLSPMAKIFSTVRKYSDNIEKILYYKLLYVTF